MGFPTDVFGGGINSSIADRIAKKKAETQKEQVHLQTDDALDLIAVLGKDINDLKIPKEAIEYIGEHPFAVYYDTSFLGQPCDNVMLGFARDFAAQTDQVDMVYITLIKPTFWECKAYLDSRLGECHDCGTTPYVAVNGGAVTYLTYYKDGVKYYLSMGSANYFYRLQLSLAVPVNPPKRQGLGILNPAGFMAVGRMDVTKEEAPATASEDTKLRFCPECGSKCFGKFCGECGKKLEN